MEIEAVSGRNRRETAEFLKARWFSDKMAVHGELVDLAALPGFVARKGGPLRVGHADYDERQHRRHALLPAARVRHGAPVPRRAGRRPQAQALHPAAGEGGIPLRHEVEFRLALTPEKPNPEKAAP